MYNKQMLLMRKLILLFFLVAINLSYQAQVSYVFKLPMPPNNERVSSVSSSYYGQYKNEETGTIFLFDSQGVSIISIIYSYITKEQVRESSKYQVRNGYIFGVVKGDSLPCLLEDEKYYFGIQQKTTFNEDLNNASLKKLSDKSYVVNFKDGNSYTPSLITFSGKTMTLKHFDYDSATDAFNNIKDKEVFKSGEMSTEYLSPTQKEWDKLNEKLMFDKGRSFQRIN
jgi:hypothetical protein